MSTADAAMTPAAIPPAFAEIWGHLQIERVDGSIGPYAECAAPFQWRFLDSVAPALTWLASPGGTAPAPNHWWYWGQRHRGASKSTDCVVALLPAFLTCPLARRFILLSTDSDAARVLVQIAGKIVALNPALQDRVKVDRWKLTNKISGSEIEVMSSDAASFYGQLPDVIVADELTHWTSEGLWESVASTLPKRQHLVLIVLSNAGWLESWQRRVFEAMHDVPHAIVDVMAEHAPWITERQLATQRRILPPMTYRRLWDNQWVAGAGDALDHGDVEAACTLTSPILERQPGEGACLGLDLGVKRDHSALCVLLTDHRQRRIKVAWSDSWAPRPGGQVDLEVVWQNIRWAINQYRIHVMPYDPWQAEFFAQKVRGLGVRALPVNFSGQDATRMASTLLECFRSRVIDMYRDDGLLRDLSRLSIQERPTGGYRLVAARDPKYGHADRAMALAIALPLAWEGIGSVVYVEPEAPQPPLRYGARW